MISLHQLVRAIICTLSLSTILPISASAKDWEFVIDTYGNRLGLIWVEGFIERSGQLARHLTRNSFLFVPCGLGLPQSGEEFMRRASYNCGGELAYWPTNLINFVRVAQAKPVTLSGPPSTCGMCWETPFFEFKLPEDVTIDPDVMIGVELEVYPGASGQGNGDFGGGDFGGGDFGGGGFGGGGFGGGGFGGGGGGGF